jgi:hypothetical protein
MKILGIGRKKRLPEELIEHLKSEAENRVEAMSPEERLERAAEARKAVDNLTPADRKRLKERGLL